MAVIHPSPHMQNIRCIIVASLLSSQPSGSQKHSYCWPGPVWHMWLGTSLLAARRAFFWVKAITNHIPRRPSGTAAKPIWATHQIWLTLTTVEESSRSHRLHLRPPSGCTLLPPTSRSCLGDGGLFLPSRVRFSRSFGVITDNPYPVLSGENTHIGDSLQQLPM